jgi:hypothetical protein
MGSFLASSWYTWTEWTPLPFTQPDTMLVLVDNVPVNANPSPSHSIRLIID